ncbi:hypothetical protein AMECASPLE_013438 [Ameca splendens]|uniref:Uncharacterized protein n=1 Tax=Ameca splendens TaxID=208324 RepID=A0ABV1A7N3_9TELE
MEREREYAKLKRGGERERQKGEGGGECMREREHQVTRTGSTVNSAKVRAQAPGAQIALKIMDGTKPAMESNAEETQDEGQESKDVLLPTKMLQ